MSADDLEKQRAEALIEMADAWVSGKKWLVRIICAVGTIVVFAASVSTIYHNFRGMK